MVNNLKIVIIGSGNVATHMAKALDKVADVVQIHSRNIANATRLTEQLRQACPTSDLNEIVTDADLYIVSVNDDAIAHIAGHTPSTAGIWAHTSGSIPANIFAGHKKHYGVFYPLQTFNKVTDVDFSEVPMLIEGESADTCEKLLKAARLISTRVDTADSEKRKLFHRAAVFACNFANYMWCIADDILQEGGYDLTILEPLLKMTLGNALKSGPEKSQTGPARRGDTHVMQNHIEALPDDKARLYNIISQSITDRFR